MLQKRQLLSNSKDQNHALPHRKDKIMFVITILLVIIWVILLISLSLGNSHAVSPEGGWGDRSREQTTGLYHADGPNPCCLKSFQRPCLFH